MASKSSAAIRQSTESEHNPLHMQAQQQLADITEKAAAFLREMDGVQQVHQHSAQRAALKLQQAAEQLRSSTSPTELLSIQSTLMMGGVQEMAQYLQELSVTMLRMQVALVRQLPTSRAMEAAAASVAEPAAASPLNGASSAADAASAATAAMFQSWSNMLGAGLTPRDGRARHH